MTTDSQGRLWAIDDGKIAGEPITPGAAKVIGIDPTTNKIIAKILLTSPAMLPDSHMNDLRVATSLTVRKGPPISRISRLASRLLWSWSTSRRDGNVAFFRNTRPHSTVRKTYPTKLKPRSAE